MAGLGRSWHRMSPFARLPSGITSAGQWTAADVCGLNFAEARDAAKRSREHVVAPGGFENEVAGEHAMHGSHFRFSTPSGLAAVGVQAHGDYADSARGTARFTQRALSFQ